MTDEHLAQLEAMRSALIECQEFFEDRADAEYFTDSPSPVPNAEMRMLGTVNQALSLTPSQSLSERDERMKAEGRREGLEEAAKAVEEKSAQLGQKQCCGNGVHFGPESPPECCGDPLFMISGQEAASVIRSLMETDNNEAGE